LQKKKGSKRQPSAEEKQARQEPVTVGAKSKKRTEQMQEKKKNLNQEIKQNLV